MNGIKLTGGRRHHLNSPFLGSFPQRGRDHTMDLETGVVVGVAAQDVDAGERQRRARRWSPRRSRSKRCCRPKRSEQVSTQETLAAVAGSRCRGHVPEPARGRRRWRTRRRDCESASDSGLSGAAAPAPAHGERLVTFPAPMLSTNRRHALGSLVSGSGEKIREVLCRSEDARADTRGMAREKGRRGA